MLLLSILKPGMFSFNVRISPPRVYMVSVGFCSLFMGSVEVPSQGAQIVKVPAAHYEFGANLIDQRVKFLSILC